MTFAEACDSPAEAGIARKGANLIMVIPKERDSENAGATILASAPRVIPFLAQGGTVFVVGGFCDRPICVLNPF